MTKPNKHCPAPEASNPISPRRTAARCLASLTVMLPWPLLGILITNSHFDDPSETTLIFGSIFVAPIASLTSFAQFPDELYAGLALLLWMTAAIAPTLLFRKRLTSWLSLGVLLIAQSAFAFANAALATFVISVAALNI